MANALYVDALKGYEYYLKQRGKAKLDEINDYLMRESRNPIAQRTYTHYHNLLRHGFRSYMPINKFDVIASLNQLQAASDRRRYHREPFTTTIQISKDGKNWIDALTIDRSLVGFGLISKKPFPAKPFTPGYLKLAGHKIIPIAFVWQQVLEKNTRFGVRAPELIANYRLRLDEIALERLGGSIVVSRNEEGPIEWTSLYSALEKTNELLRGVTDLLYTLEELMGVDITLAEPVLKSIKFSSPGAFEILLDKSASLVLGSLKGLFERIFFFALYKRKLRAEAENLELDVAKKKVDLVKDVFHLGEEIRNSDLPSQAASAIVAIIPYLFDANRPIPKEMFAPDSPEMAILVNRIVPAALGLQAGDDPEYKIDVKSPSKKNQGRKTSQNLTQST
jgi:hypothetical protein